MRKNLVEFAIHDTFEEGLKAECEKHRLAFEEYTNYSANLDDDLVIVFLGLVKAEKGYNYSFKDFPFYRLLFTVSGQAKLTYPKKTFTIKSGSVAGFAPKDTGFISVETKTPWEHYFLHFTGKEAATIFEQSMLPTQKVIHASNPPKILQYFQNMIEEERHGTDFSHAINVYQLRILLLQLANDIYRGNEDHCLASRETYLSCRNYINQHFSEITCFQELVEACGISKVYFCRLFKQYANTSPMAYVMNLKMNKAAVLLRQTDLSIKQISGLLRFENQYYFSNLFKKYYGIAPKFYRKKHD